MTLPNRIRDYVAKAPKGTWIDKDTITRVAQKHGYSVLDVLDALRTVHRMKDMECKVKGDTILYRIRVLRAPRPIETFTPPPYPTHVTDIDTHPFFTPEERVCYRTPFKDRSDECHRLCDTPAGYTITMERKHGVQKWNRMRQEGALCGIL